MTIQLSVVICTYNRAQFLPRTLHSLVPQTLDRNIWETVVVNNNSTDNTDQAIAQFAAENPMLQVVTAVETKQGLSHARNCGIELCRGRYIVFIDDDQEVNPEFLQAYFDFFESHPSAIAAGGVVEPLYEFQTPRWLTPYAERPIAGTVYLGDKITLFKGSSYPPGGNMGFRSEAFQKYGVFNPNLGRTGTSMLAGEEKDLFSRYQNAGEPLYYLPDAIVYHIIPQSRMTPEYFDKLTRMVGVSERVRCKNIGAGAYWGRIASECVKWAGVGVLLVGYTLRGRPIAGWYLVKMRWNITRGLLGYK